MRMLGEMATANPDTGSFSTYADRAIGRWAGFTIGWLYWGYWALLMAWESTSRASSCTSGSRCCRSTRSRWAPRWC